MQFNVITAILLASVSAVDYQRPSATSPVTATKPVSKPAAVTKPITKPVSKPAACRSFARGIVKDCGNSNDIFEIKNIILTPHTPVAGKPLDVHLIGKLKDEITFGSTTTISAKYDGASIMNLNLDVCQLAKDRKFKNQCPTLAKDLDIHHTLNIPAYAPAGDYSINAFGFNQDKKRIFNVSIHHVSKDRSESY